MSATPPPDSKATVVVIDDDLHILELASVILSRKGYHVLTASTARKGMEIISTQVPELALLDYMMPEMDGLATLRKIKAHYPDTYVIMFTGKGNEEIAVELMKGGASEYILKPFNNRDLLDRLDNVLRIREIELHNKALRQEHVRLLEEIDNWNQELQKRVREKTEALQKAQSEIAQSEKLAALGYLSAGMAHEIRNPLNTISLFVQLMRQNIADQEQLDYLDKVLKEVDRIDDIISKLLDASRRNRSIISDVQIDRVVDNAIDAFSPQIETGSIRVERHYRGLPPPIKADPAELEQIFTNLFLNALDEMPGGGRLEIEIYEENGRVVVRVGDSGGGIPAEALPSIFEPFFTTKSRGTGMGLPVVQRIARIYQGSIAVEKSSPEGTVFRLEFPAVFQA
ncbi:response regulator [Geobacter sp. AOG2]|uniref:hybrid sensor histidine kinase/response regulator n=1 Tax=Geobacter sp. AOG2 TaxID=1566347 RepID=UPI001CC7773B|nr:response regulator [Geobacter sp. AOG2]GFE61994.1 hybrid sensor histidine kinase/response regulator [Geobacter sp. AOG2]